MDVLTSFKESLQRRIIKQIIYRLGDSSNENIVKTAEMFEKILPDDPNFQGAYNSIKDLIKQNHPSIGLIKRASSEICPNCKEKLVENLIINGIILNQKKREKIIASGSYTPFTILISPTMRCNLKCIGCYASEYNMKDDLPVEVFDRVLTEAENMGTAFFTILGGEPLVVKEKLFEIAKKHNKSYFQFYTNGTLITDEVAMQIKELGNLMPIISIEGYEKETDQRRGKGIYKKAMNAMDILKKYRIPFGFSVAVTNKNAEVVSSDEFMDLMINKGGYIGWYFLYMPLGQKPDLKLMPTPKQRKMLLDRWRIIRNTKPIFIVDFWNDAPAVGGCIAGKFYIHINSNGDVEPCIFTHFACDNIKNKPLAEVMKSDLFKELRAKQPFNENLYLPCMWIDNPEISREIFARHNCYPTHRGAEAIIKNKKIKSGIEKYSKEVKKLYDPIWEKEQKKSECNCGM